MVKAELRTVPMEAALRSNRHSLTNWVSARCRAMWRPTLYTCTCLTCFQEHVGRLLLVIPQSAPCTNLRPSLLGCTTNPPGQKCSTAIRDLSRCYLQAALSHLPQPKHGWQHCWLVKPGAKWLSWCISPNSARSSGGAQVSILLRYWSPRGHKSFEKTIALSV